MNGSEDERLLEDYLRGGSELSRRYRELGDEELPTGIDERILARAADAVRVAPARPARIPRSWYFGIATTAVIVLSVAVVLETGVLESMAPRSPASSAPATAPRTEDARERKSDESGIGTPGTIQAPTETAAHAPQAEVARPDLRDQVLNDTSSRVTASPTAAPANEPPASAASPPFLVRQEQEVRAKQSRSNAVAVPAPAVPTADAQRASEPARVEQGSAAGVAASARPSAPAALESSGFLDRPSSAERDLARDPEEWINEIIRLRAAGESAQADRELERFIALNPDFPVPAAAKAAPGGRAR